MTNSSNTKSGFTLVELLVSLAIMVVFLPFAANMLTNSQLLSSYSKHKIEAAYAAQQILETQRQEPLSYFAPILATANPANNQSVGLVALDTKGNYANINCNTNPTLFCGTATITITPETFTNAAGQQTKYTATYTPGIGAPYNYYTIAHVNIQISWTEQVLSIRIPMNEYYASDLIVNDPMLN